MSYRFATVQSEFGQLHVELEACDHCGKTRTREDRREAWLKVEPTRGIAGLSIVDIEKYRKLYCSVDCLLKQMSGHSALSTR